MARVGEYDAPDLRVHHGIEHGEKHLGAGELIGERFFEPAQYLRGRVRGFGVDTGRGHHERHDQGGAEAVTRHVADHHADAVGAEVEQVIEVSPHRLGLAAARGHVDARRHHERRGEQLELEIARQLELA